MTVAAETRAAVREHPFLHTALRANIVNYTAAARFLGVGDIEAVAAALRRYAEELDALERTTRRVSVSMKSGVESVDEDSGEEANGGLLSIGDRTFVDDGGDLTAIVAVGKVELPDLEVVLGRLRTAEINAIAAAGTDGHVAVVVERRAGPDAVRLVEDALSNP
ncbi:DUF7523 family protein [Natronomonas salsuginis]|uniref:Uncharacterized protein n=1 Tax=Natronomonas salsuginis TaxID=2217661 RepID=A0A4U5JFJ8_9EURY|nr:hypothetical protein [Natronomonas salsuginis]TKR28162.1 hypothetical protein DM868_03525 [Natronomonas salsuginis]